MDDFYIIIPFERLMKDRKKRLIDFNALDIGPGFRKGLSQCANSGANFKDQVSRTDLCFFCNAPYDGLIDEEVLSKAFFCMKTKGIKNIPRNFTACNHRMEHTEVLSHARRVSMI